MDIQNYMRMLLAAGDGDHEKLKQLLLGHDNLRENEVLLRAAYNGHTECVKLLIPVSHVKKNHSAALAGAALNQHYDCVDLLYPVSDPTKALIHLANTYPNYRDQWRHLEERVNAERIHATIHQEVGEVGASKIQRKM